MRVLVDAQLPPALARALAAAGTNAEHVCDCGLATAPDGDLWRRAQATGAVIVTKDEDFALRLQLAADGPAVVWIRYGNVRNAELLRRISAVWPTVIEAIGRGERLVELA